ncbi:hypothetical protein MJ904_25785 [Massilia sp. MB5]|uniref:hypothetical protein n=1 Tax=Massilia sp. MB5 TaxID=2919578 RepID=UPI001F0DBCB2|nr:hypothetical protein [Massilia sp. MB5]UMR30351.1 hypothetical protein MJ904_25785 [Massilia sp. MB5]
MLPPYAALALILCLTAPALAADQPNPPITSSTELSRMRDGIEGLSGPNASSTDLQQAARRLDAGLDWLNANRERMNGSPTLLNERVNLQLARAEIHARLGRKNEALAALEEMQTLVWLPQLRRALRDAPSFASLRAEPRFKAVLATAYVPERAMQTKALATSYKDQLSLEERVAGLSLFWAEARHGFAHFDNVPALNWDKVYMEYLSKVIAARDTREYYRVMLQLAPLLRDGHTNIYPPRELMAEFFPSRRWTPRWPQEKSMCAACTAPASPPASRSAMKSSASTASRSRSMPSSTSRLSPATPRRRTAKCVCTPTSCWPAPRSKPCVSACAAGTACCAKKAWRVPAGPTGRRQRRSASACWRATLRMSTSATWKATRSWNPSATRCRKSCRPRR